MKQPFLIGEFIYLRALLEADLNDGAYIDWLNDAEVCQFNSHHLFPYTPSQGRDYIQSVTGNTSALVLAICLKENNRHIGNIALNRIDPIARQAEYAILMGDKSAWGKGYAKEASFLICHHGFQALNLNRIYCGTSEHNIPMQKLATYMAMQPEGRRRQAQYKQGHYIDILEYGVLRNEFVAKFQLENVNIESCV